MKSIATRRDAIRIIASAGITILGMLTIYGITRSKQINPSPDANIGAGMIYLFGMGVAIIGGIILLASILHLVIRNLTNKLQLSRMLALSLTALVTLIVWYIFVGAQMGQNAAYQEEIASRYSSFAKYQEPVKLSALSSKQSTSVSTTDGDNLPLSIRLDLHACDPGVAEVRDATGTTHFAFSGVERTETALTSNHCIFYIGRETAGQPWDQTLNARCNWMIASSQKNQYGDQLLLKVDDTGIQFSDVLGLCQDLRTGRAPTDLSSPALPPAQAEAIRQAKEYHPDRMCPQAITPAIHEATGAEYTFNNGCLPPGWKAAPRQQATD